MYKTKLIFIFVLIFILFGCASTDFYVVQNPDVVMYDYDSILIQFNTENIKNKTILEEEFYKQFTKQKINAYKSIELFSPLNEYSPSEISDILESKKIELILEIDILNEISKQGETSTYIYPIGDYYFGGASTEIELTVDFNIEIIDLALQRTVLKGTVTCTDENSNFSECSKNIYKTFAEEVVNKYFIRPLENNSEY